MSSNGSRKSASLFIYCMSVIVCSGTVLAQDIQPGTTVDLDSSSSHGVIKGNGCALVRDCTVKTGPNRVQVLARHDHVGVTDISGYMDRFFTVTSSFTGAENTLEALIRLALRVNGRIIAQGGKATSVLRVVVDVRDLSEDLQISRGLASNLTVRGGATTVGFSNSATGIGVDIALPELDDVKDEPVRHLVSVPLRRGHSYRLRVIVQATVQQELSVATIAETGLVAMEGEPLPGKPGGVFWESATVALGDDQVEVLEMVDAALAQHDAALTQHDAALAQHDQDIKDDLSNLQDRLEEIRLLLLTPQGRRPGWPSNERRGAGSTGPGEQGGTRHP